jgi:sugar lactone lactonase YvrE
MHTSSTPGQERRWARRILRSLFPIFCGTVLGMATTSVTGQGGTLPLLLPSAIVYDSLGDLFIADASGQVVRELSASGAITVVAGNGIQGFEGDGGAATSAELDSPAGLAIDAAGNLYIADSHNHRIRKISSATGVITTIAGTGVAGFSGDGGSATRAQLALPMSLALDSSGNLYVADTHNHRIRRISTTGAILTIAGTGVEGFAGDGGSATAAMIDTPSGLAVDGAGNLYLADRSNGRIREVSAASGLINTVAGTGGQAYSGDGGAATGASLARPRGISIDAAGDLIVADSGNQRIRKISPSGTITTIAGEGTQAFAGDGGAAVSASLNTPGAVVNSPAGLVTLVDTGNQRLRQLDALAAPGPNIHTLPEVIGSSSASLVLTGPAMVVYGSGAVTVDLTASGIATGSIALVDSSNPAVTLQAASVSSTGLTTLSIGTLAAGAHTLVAVYSGDGTHQSSQSAALTVTVTPLPVTGAPTAVSILYGQAVPALSGTLTGLLARDAGSITAVFSSAAGSSSPPGVYPISVVLNGNAAGDYTLTVSSGVVAIGKAPPTVMLTSSSTAMTPGSPLNLSVQVASSTSGTPTGNVTFLDGGTALAIVPVNPAGSANFSTASLAAGTHSMAATYSGDADFLPATSTAAMVTVAASSDFTLATTGSATQSVAAGSATTFNFSATMVGPALASPILLTVQGLPRGATASFNPSTLPPGSTNASFTMTIQTPMARLEQRAHTWPRHTAPASGALLAIVLFPFLSRTSRRRKRSFVKSARSRSIRPSVLIVICISLLSLGSGCGDRVNSGLASGNTITYTLTVTGTATGPSGTVLQQSVNVTLEVL